MSIPDAYYTQSTGVGVNLHLHRESVLDVRAYPDEDRVTLSIGEHAAKITVFIDGDDLARLYELLDDAAFKLGRSLSDTANDAYASGWDAAIAWVQTSTGEPVPAHAPAVKNEAG